MMAAEAEFTEGSDAVRFWMFDDLRYLDTLVPLFLIAESPEMIE